MDKFPAEFGEKEQKSAFKLAVEEQLKSLLKTVARQEIYALHDESDTPGVVSKSESSNIDEDTNELVATYMRDISLNPVFQEIIELTEVGSDELDGVAYELATFIVDKYLNPDVDVDAA